LDHIPEPRFRPGIVSTDEFGNIVLGPREVGQEIAVFTGNPREQYEITCSTIRSAPELDKMSPKPTIALDPLEVEGDMVSNFVLLVATAALAALALVAAVIYISIPKKPSLTDR
jgi:hypothetical protein